MGLQKKLSECVTVAIKFLLCTVLHIDRSWMFLMQ